MSQIKISKLEDNNINCIKVDFTYNLPVSLSKAKEMISKKDVNENELSPCEKLFFKTIKNKKQVLKTAIENFKSFCDSSEQKYPIALVFPDMPLQDQTDQFYYVRFNENEDSSYIFTTTQIKYSVSEEGTISIQSKRNRDNDDEEKKVDNVKLLFLEDVNRKKIDNGKLFAEDVNCFQEIVDLSKEGASFVIPDEDTKEILEICKEREGKKLHQLLNDKYERMEEQKKANSEHQEGKSPSSKKEQEKPLENSCPFFYCCSGRTDAEKNTEIINLK